MGASLGMDLFTCFKISNDNEGVYWILIMTWPAFAVRYMSMASFPILCSICVSLRNLGDFMAMSRWPLHLFCGDPMNCWRSQYLFSHAIFYSSGGDQGNISYALWYLFVKS